MVEELDVNLGDLDAATVSMNGLESKLPYTMACINENFRINSVFTMPLERAAMAPNGAQIGGHSVPGEVSTSDGHALPSHRNR